MPFSPKSIEENPYNQCIYCIDIGKLCDGPDFLALSIRGMSAWCRLRKDYLHALDSKWTNAYVAELAHVAKISVDRFLAGKIEDIKLSTIARIIQVLVTQSEATDGAWGKHPCPRGALPRKDLAPIQ